ncbi:uncharacterized protein LOC109539045 isoform X1 [Dendroctonus ponderosae]|uniref:uncharacterized protein LOC109539045 isoform X1 n=2 Tax=Dendroctonus ponderosae TaxID=77166 RepID=UPI002034E644|nr:uncharacterized protein LOC109539045 isoform X1 [Dendroctonus ponderosae]
MVLTITAIDIWADIILFVQTLNTVEPIGQYTLWESRTFDFSNTSNMEGSLIIENAQISVEMEYNLSDFSSVTEDDDGNFKACISNVNFPKFNFSFDYIADFGINNKFPIYGNGSYQGRLIDIATTFCWLLASSADEILDFNIDVIFWHHQASLTGFYRNPELSSLLGDSITDGKKLFAMWNNYDTKCSSQCILNPVFHFFINYLMYGIEDRFELNWADCTCLIDFVKSSLPDKSSPRKYGQEVLDEIVNYLVENMVHT